MNVPPQRNPADPGAATRWKGALSEWLPAPARQRLRKYYYLRMLRRFREDQWDCSAAVRSLVRKGDVVVDAGANIGYVTMLLSGWVGPEGRVFSLEPVPETFEILYHNMTRLGLANVRPLRFGVSSRDRDALFEIPRYAWGGENLYESHLVSDGADPIRKARTVHVHLRTLDSVLAEDLDAVKFVKLDVEGHEYEAVEGAHELIRRATPAFLVEVSSHPEENGSTGHKLFSLFGDFGYGAYLFDGGRFRPRGCGERRVDYFFLTDNHLANLPLQTPPGR